MRVRKSVALSEVHLQIIEKILNGEHTKPYHHDSASDVIRKAIEHYADFLGVKFEKIKSEG